MSDRADPAPPLMRLQPTTVGLLVLGLAVLVAAVTFARHQAELGPTRGLVDFDAFFLAGRLAWEGLLADAYRTETFFEVQSALSGKPRGMPYSYPPPYGLLAAVLGLLDGWVAYALFIAASLGAFLLVLRRLAGDSFGAVMVLTFPILVLGVLIGQNGFLSGTILGLFALRALSGSPGAGGALGLMVLKPHLALGLGLYALLVRRWDWVAGALLVALGACLLATLAFGPAIWPAFLAGAAESNALLRDGVFPLFRMASAYATVRSAGFGAEAALAVHALVAVLATTVLVLAVRNEWAPRRLLALALLVTLTVSPYLYDYDLTLLALALALAAPDLSRMRHAFPALLVLLWFAGFYSYAMGWLVHRHAVAGAEMALADRPVALAGPAALGAMALIAWALARGERRA